MASTMTRTDAGVLNWATAFRDLVTVAPTTYGLTAALVTSLSSSIASYAASLPLTERSVRTKFATAQKKAFKKALLAQLDTLQNLINGTPSVTVAQKLQLGMSVRTAPAPIPAPDTAPIVSIESVNAWTVRVKLGNAEATKRARPRGAVGAAIFSHVGTGVPTDISDWGFEGVVGSPTVDIVFKSSLPAGTQVFLTAMWFSNRKQSGPCCAPVATFLQGGGVQSVGMTTLALAA